MCGNTVKVTGLTIGPATVVSVIGPVAAPGGTTTMTFVADADTIDSAGVPPKLTAVVEPRSVPSIVMVSPTTPFFGETVAIFGAITSNADAVVAVDTGVTTLILPSGT